MSTADVELDALLDFIRIPSVSADPARRADVEQAAAWLAAQIRSAGGKASVRRTERHPLVVGELRASRRDRERVPTVLLYGHYDVQPAGLAEEWRHPPFEPVVEDGWILGRGAADDKGPLLALLSAARDLFRTGRLEVDVRFLADGEEEVLGDSVVSFLLADERGADACLILDGVMPERGQPAFVTGTRGLVSLAIEVQAARRDLHSGFFGGAAANAAHVLVDMLAVASRVWRLGEHSVPPPTAAERAQWRRLPPGAVVLAAEGAVPLDEVAAEQLYERTTAATSFDVSALGAGDLDARATVIPARASAHVSVRFVAPWTASAVAETLERALREAAPPGVQVEITPLALTPSTRLEQSSRALELAAPAFAAAFEREPVRVRTGGSLPIMAALAERGIPTLLSGIDVHEGNAHAPNERLLVDHLRRGKAAAIGTLTAWAHLPVSRPG